MSVGLTYAEFRKQVATYREQRVAFDSEKAKRSMDWLRVFTPVIPALVDAVVAELDAAEDLFKTWESALQRIEQAGGDPTADPKAHGYLQDFARVSARIDDLVAAIHREREVLARNRPSLRGVEINLK